MKKVILTVIIIILTIVNIILFKSYYNEKQENKIITVGAVVYGPIFKQIL